MRTITRVALAASAFGLMACSHDATDKSAQSDLQKDLALAVPTGPDNQVVSATELVPTSTPDKKPAPKPKPAPERHPTPKIVQANHDPVQAQSVAQTASTSAPATTGAVINDGGVTAAPTPRPQPVAVNYPGDNGGYGGVGCGGMCRGGGGGVTVILRGGHAGDDNCEPGGGMGGGIGGVIFGGRGGRQSGGTTSRRPPTRMPRPPVIMPTPQLSTSSR